MTTGRDKVSRGEALRIPADVWNDLLDMRGWWKSKRLESSGSNESPGGLCLVKNSSGSAIDAYQVLGINGVITTPAQRLSEFQQRWALDGITPTTASHAGKFVITAEPIPNGKFGWATLWGVSPVQMAVGASAHTFADVTNSDATKLTTGYGGCAQVLYVAGSSGTQWGLVRLGAAVGYKPYIIFSLAAALELTDASQTGTIQQQWGPGVDSPHTGAGAITLHNPAQSSGYLYEGNSGTYGFAVWRGDGSNYIINGLPCRS